ncbi:MAG TPA: dispase autolysis-inducing protein [Thermoanaerobaculia bacterium]|nr:dispase autolysis-inducing protein [Thermoanaerobaculia bacterium]
MSRRILLSLLVLVLALPAAAASRRRASRSPRFYPLCSMVTGTGAVTFTRDEGQTLAPTAESITPIAYTWGVAALDEPETLLAWHKSDLLISNDGGCSWRVAAHIEGWDFPPTLTPAKGGRAYAWSENRKFLYRYDTRGAVSLKQPVDFMGLGVDPNDGEHLRAGGNDGSVWESKDAGATWTHIGALEGSPLYYKFAFDPMNLDHIVAGTLANGAYVSRDGGKSWTRGTGIATRSANVFQLVFSPVDGNRVWAMGIDRANTDDAAHGRHIYVSDDGGNTWRTVVDEAPGVKLINGPTMAAHPTNRDVVYFIFGSHFQGYGTDIFRYDAATNALTLTHNDYDGVNAIAFSRNDPGVMYLGLERID